MSKFSNALCTLHSALAVALFCAACEPDSVQYVTVQAASDPGLTDSAFLSAQSNTGLGDRNLADVDGADFGALEYRADDEKRIYIFQGDIEFGVLGDEYLHFPLPLASLTPRTVAIPPPDGPKWGSLRAYDVGVCSSLITWEDIGGSLFGVLLAQLEGRPELIGVSRPNPARIIPVLRMTARGAGALPDDFDTIILNASFHVDEIDGPANEGCTNVDLDLTLEVQLNLGSPRHQDQIESDEGVVRCMNREGETNIGIFAAGPNGTARPYVAPDGANAGATVVGLSVTVKDTASCGLLAGPDYIENLVAEAIRGRVGNAIRDEVVSRTIFPAARFLPGAEDRACSCDIECSEGARVRNRRTGRLGPPLTNPYGAGSGYRHDCVAGRCALRVEPERIFSRPEGVEIVVAEDTQDGVYPIITTFRECRVDRNSVPAARLAPTRGQMRVLTIP